MESNKSSTEQIDSLILMKKQSKHFLSFPVNEILSFIILTSHKTPFLKKI
jgi:hypothetical protein